MKRVLAIGDLHCGHVVGLTPPEWQYKPEFKKLQREMWEFFTRTVDALQPIDVLLVNGDAIDGRGERSGGTELITTDILEQCQMAEACIKRVGARSIEMTYGTPYHAGQDTDYEAEIARNVGARINGHAFFTVNGVSFDCKHKIGGSGIPHGRGTALAKEMLWNLLWHEIDGAPRGDIFLRSHVHYCFGVDSEDRIGYTLPALQGLGSKFGERACSGTVHFGAMSFDIQDDGSFSWSKHKLNLKAARPAVAKY